MSRSSRPQTAAGMPGGIGLAEARSEHVTTPSLGLARAPTGVDFGVPEWACHPGASARHSGRRGSGHQSILAALTQRLARPAFRQTIMDAPDAASIVSFVQGEVAAP